MNLYSASAAQGLLEGFAAARAAMSQVPLEIPAPAAPPYEPFARTTLAIEWTRRPTYCVVPQSGPNKSNNAVIHWVDLYCGPITFQIRDQLGLKSTLALLSRTHKTAVAVFLDGPQHADDPTAMTTAGRSRHHHQPAGPCPGPGRAPVPSVNHTSQ